MGQQLFTTRDYHEILGAPPMSMLSSSPQQITGTAKVSVDAMKAGKDGLSREAHVQSLDEGKVLN